MHKSRTLTRILTAILGGLVTLIGVVLVPYPGPGWLIVFAGLAILAREFAWAQRLLDRVRKRYDGFYAWVKERGSIAQALLFIGTCFIVVLTLWLLNAYGIIAGWVGIDWGWLRSPFAAG